MPPNGRWDLIRRLKGQRLKLVYIIRFSVYLTQTNMASITRTIGEYFIGK